MNGAPTVSTELLQVRRDAGVWFARLNRPDKRNALSDELVTSIAATCERVAADLEARALVIHGAGGHFCAGADFSGFLALMQTEPGQAGDPIAIYNRQFGALLEQLAALPVPTIAVVTGVAMGGGCGLAAACDRVIAADDATFAMPEVTLGVAPAQIAPFVVRRAGARRARWLMLSGVRLKGAAARDAGLADTVVPAAELRDVLAAELRLLAAAEPAALRATKRIVNRTLEAPLGTSLDAAAQEFAGLLRHGSAREGIAATMARRAPAWITTPPDLTDLP
ncbi:MAG: enoyl-CoA hydratase/isomerase family protein [Steroidobacteraceae bacterium]|nr:enoyl-CoA hydratase/isomerase family protein [Steroidobacteraceae bacterium]